MGNRIGGPGAEPATHQARCNVCHLTTSLRKDGTLRKHGYQHGGFPGWETGNGCGGTGTTNFSEKHVLATDKGTPIAEAIDRAAAAAYQHVMENREAYLRAWVAETGLAPSECMLVEQDDGQGGRTVTVKRITPTEDAREPRGISGREFLSELEKRRALLSPDVAREIFDARGETEPETIGDILATSGHRDRPPPDAPVERERMVAREHWDQAIRERDQARSAFVGTNCIGPWMWQDDGGNFLDSMGEGMVVQMTAGTLRQLVAEPEALRAWQNEAPSTRRQFLEWLREQGPVIERIAADALEALREPQPKQQGSGDDE